MRIGGSLQAIIGDLAADFVNRIAPLKLRQPRFQLVDGRLPIGLFLQTADFFLIFPLEIGAVDAVGINQAAEKKAGEAAQVKFFDLMAGLRFRQHQHCFKRREHLHQQSLVCQTFGLLQHRFIGILQAFAQVGEAVVFIKALLPHHIALVIEAINQACAVVRGNAQAQHLPAQHTALFLPHRRQTAVNPLRTSGGMIDLTAAGRAFFIIQIRINQARGIVNIFLEFQRIFAEIVHQAEQFTGQIQAQLSGQHFGDGGGFGEVGGKRL